ncbi:MAG: helix-turn-helix domain-containing protein [Clostridiales Family XIII bacterium]|jgi:ArsR family transcriptional regulator|nr:helix-turn-helix domain-containing protein [Clostridiales Family XIII bacterium]
MIIVGGFTPSVTPWDALAAAGGHGGSGAAWPSSPALLLQRNAYRMRLRKEPDEMHEDEALLIARVSDALAHPARVSILKHIMRRNAENAPVFNKDLVESFNYSQATISQHVKKLAQADLVQVKRKDSYSMYYVNIGVMRRYVDAVNKFHL